MILSFASFSLLMLHLWLFLFYFFLLIYFFMMCNSRPFSWEKYRIFIADRQSFIIFIFFSFVCVSFNNIFRCVSEEVWISNLCCCLWTNSFHYVSAIWIFCKTLLPKWFSYMSYYNPFIFFLHFLEVYIIRYYLWGYIFLI